MNARKRADRAKIRFDGKKNTGYVKPNTPTRYGIIENTSKRIDLDADGNVIPDD